MKCIVVSLFLLMSYTLGQSYEYALLYFDGGNWVYKDGQQEHAFPEETTGVSRLGCEDDSEPQNNFADVLNCLGKQGWQLVTISSDSTFFFMRSVGSNPSSQ